MFENKINTKGKQSDQTPFEVLKTQVYPVINDVILKVFI